MIKKIDHIGIAVESLEDRLPFWAKALGMTVSDIETVSEEQVKVAFLPAGESRIELLEATAESSAVAKFLDKRGAGIHHITLEVADLPAMLQQVRREGVEILGEAPRTGAGGRQVAFLHPRSTGGVLLELVEGQEAAPPKESGEIRPGDPILLYLREPQEKLWGLLSRLDAAGVMLQGIDLSSFDDWVAQIESGDESVVGPSALFVPMGRVEKMLLDRSSGHLSSMADRFHKRTGRTVSEVLGQDG